VSEKITHFLVAKGKKNDNLSVGPRGLNNLRGIGLECRRSNNNQFNNVL